MKGQGVKKVAESAEQKVAKVKKFQIKRPNYYKRNNSGILDVFI